MREACKPSSVENGHSSGAAVTGGLVQPTRPALSPLRSDRQGKRRTDRPPLFFKRRRGCLVLLPMGFALPPPSPAARWALTPPFHPYPCLSAGRRINSATGDTIQLLATSRHKAKNCFVSPVWLLLVSALRQRRFVFCGTLRRRHLRKWTGAWTLSSMVSCGARTFL